MNVVLWILQVLVGLVVWAAGGVMIVTVSATVLHVVRNEMSSAVITLVLFGLAAFLADGRHRVRPIRARRPVGRVVQPRRPARGPRDAAFVADYRLVRGTAS
jgi:hypothetical protein